MRRPPGVLKIPLHVVCQGGEITLQSRAGSLLETQGWGTLRHIHPSHTWWGEKHSQVRVTELLHSGKYTPSPINDKDKKSAGLVSSFPSFNKREAAHSFRFPCGAAPTHSKPGQTKAPAQCPLAFSWLFALFLENIHKIHSKPWVVSVMTCLDGSAPATNQLSQQTLLSWHSVTGSPTLWSQLS